jgi:hypothetical protein
MVASSRPRREREIVLWWTLTVTDVDIVMGLTRCYYGGPVSRDRFVACMGRLGALTTDLKLGRAAEGSVRIEVLQRIEKPDHV